MRRINRQDHLRGIFAAAPLDRDFEEGDQVFVRGIGCGQVIGHWDQERTAYIKFDGSDDSTDVSYDVVEVIR